MNAQETERYLSNEIADVLEIPYYKARQIYQTIVKTLAKGYHERKDLCLTGVGVIHPYWCRPKTYYLDGVKKTKWGEDRIEKPGRWKVVFRPSRHLLTLLNDSYLGPETLDELYQHYEYVEGETSCT